jgi:catechol-2,3-dioxygenase
MRISQLELWTRQLPEQRRFYTEGLGLPITEATPQRLALQADETLLTWQHSTEPLPGVYHFAFNVPTHQFASAKARVAARVPLIRDRAGADDFHFEDWDAHAFYFYDPAGNIVECIARHTLNNARSEAFDARQLLCVSEVGIAVESVPASVQALTASLGVQPYLGGSADFTPLGDEAGLLILVRRERQWFPDTGQPAVPLPIQIIVQNSADARLRLNVIPAESPEPQISPLATGPSAR